MKMPRTAALRPDLRILALLPPDTLQIGEYLLVGGCRWGLQGWGAVGWRGRGGLRVRMGGRGFFPHGFLVVMFGLH